MNWLELKTEICEELDLDPSELEIVDESELIIVANAAIRECCHEVYKWNQDYYRDYDWLQMVAGESVYNQPDNIFANKYRYVECIDGNTIYKVDKCKVQDRSWIGPLDEYYYDLDNNYDEGTKFILCPAARETSSSRIKRWFIRKPFKIVDDSSRVDIPSVIYVRQVIKNYLMEKDNHPMLEKGLADKDTMMQLFVSTLQEMIPDDDKQMEGDYTHYEEHE